MPAKADPAADLETEGYRNKRQAEPSSVFLPNGTRAQICGPGEWHNVWAAQAGEAWQEWWLVQPFS